MGEMTFAVAPSKDAPKHNIRLVEPTLHSDCSRCEGNVNLGVFFDGTDNNLKRDLPNLGHSNIARLFHSYREDPTDAYYKLYVPGVGTPFPEIGEEGESNLGNGFAIGSEQRVLYALLWVFNALQRAATDKPMFTDGQMRALCCTQNTYTSFTPPEDYAELDGLGLQAGLRMPDTVGQGEREAILKKFAVSLHAVLSKSKIKLKECFIDVFGFSRGAAEARVFCNWFNSLLIKNSLAGVIVHFRFLGIMDTVASAGFWSSMVGSLTGLGGGHSGWANAEYLSIPSSIVNCVHMVSMHELRRNFPLDTITVNGIVPKNCVEYAYPGAHSDVGGGYNPGALGVSVGRTSIEGDALKLSQIPLRRR